MASKVDRAAYGPSWTEVILGAFLSLVLGVILGALLLVFRPVTAAREEPKEREKNTVYFIEGSKDSGKGRQAPAKRQALLQGQSVTLTEEEVNVLIAPAAGAPGAEKKAPPQKTKDGKDAEKSASAEYLAAGAANVRIANGELQVAVPVTIDLIGQKVIAQARGGFEKEGAMFVYKPTEMYLGSWPVHRLPLVADLVRNKFLQSQPIPDDLKAAWEKLAGVSVQGNTLKLTMP
jgi:hypothetical protein